MKEITESDPKTWYEIWLPRISVALILLMVVWFGGSWVFTSTSSFLITMIMAFFVAFALLPAVEFLSRRGWKRGAAAGVVMFAGASIAALFVFAIGNVFFGQLTNFLEALPGIVDTVADWLNDTLGLELNLNELGIEVSDVAGYAAGLGTGLIGVVTGLTGSILGLVFSGLTIGLFVFYILADWPKLRAAILGWMPPDQQVTADTVFSITIDKVGGWVYSRGALAAISALFHFVVFLVIGLPYPFALALWVGVISQFIPTIGTYLAGIVPVFIALVSGDPIDALWVLLAILFYQQIENYLISPKITANTMDLHPAVAFGSAIIGASLLGGIGALLALPVAAALTALAQIYGVHHELIESEHFESPQQYGARMREVDEEKTRKKHERYRKLGLKVKDSDDGAPAAEGAE
jgi:predicted PurR-regulated permease PerM